MAKTRASIDRRGFLKRATAGAAAGAAALVTNDAEALAPHEATDQTAVAAGGPPSPPPAPSTEQLARETGTAMPPAVPPRTVVRPGSDLLVDALVSVGIHFVMANPGSSFEGMQESIVNHGRNDLEFITALHEESSVAAAHGYAKATGRPMATLLHGVIGVQHAAMAIYNAYVDRVPIVMIAGLDFDGPVAAHNATDMGALVRGFTKWDAQPPHARRWHCGHSARLSGRGDAADRTRPGDPHGGDSKGRDRGTRDCGASVPPAADPGRRLSRDQAHCRGAGRGAESADQRRPAAHARRCAARHRARRAAWRADGQ